MTVQVVMASKKDPSVYDLLRARLIFTDEPLWFRIIMCLIAGGIMIAIIWSLHEWAVPAFVWKKLFGPKILQMLRAGKSDSS